MKKKTGISLCDKNFDKYLDWLKSESISYKILNYHENNFDDVKECSSLLLTGGDDIFPEFYHDWEDGKDRSHYKPERDGFEFKLLDFAIENKIPILGICRGLQLINCKMNGSLINDLEIVRKVNHKKYDDTMDREHNVNIFEGTLLKQILREKDGIINSSHHQAIDRLGERLMISAKSPDGIIEAIELSDKTNVPFFLGVQWHPERMVRKDSPFTKNLLLKFKEVTEL